MKNFSVGLGVIQCSSFSDFLFLSEQGRHGLAIKSLNLKSLLQLNPQNSSLQNQSRANLVTIVPILSLIDSLA